MSITDSPAPEPTKPYPMGVVFVHGIGDQPSGDTLKSVVDPIVRSLDLWIHGAARCRAAVAGEAAAAAWAEGMPKQQGEPEDDTLVREQAFEMAWSAKDAARTELLPGQAADVKASAVWSGNALLRDGWLQESASGGDTPSHAVLQIHTTGEHYQVNQASALVAESWWARSFVPPSPQALLSWTFKVLPLAIGMHIGDVLRRHALRAGDAQAALWRRVWHGWLALLSVVVMTLLVPLALPLQCLLVGTVVLSALPLRFIQDAMRAVQSTLIGTLGDSFLLVSSPVSRAMIVAQCKRDIHWLADRCEQVVVVAHSQGCAVSYLALSESLPAEVCGVTWVGSGLRKLEILRAAERDNFSLLSGWFVATGPLVAWLMVSGMFSHWSWDSAPGQIVITLAALGAYLAGLAKMTFLLRAGATGARLRLWRDKDLTLTDIHASHDPVPHGPLFDEHDPQASGLYSSEVRNRASPLTDHTSYWRNIEEVVLPLGLRMAALLGVPLDHLLNGDADWLARSVRRRHHRVRVLSTLRWVLLAGGAWLLWQHRGEWAAWGRTVIDQLWQLADTDATLSSPATTGPLRRLLPELVLGLVVPYVGMMLAWLGWEANQQRAFLLRRHPPGLLEFLLIGIMVGTALTPAGVAATPLLTDGSGPIALAMILLVSLFAGIFYVLSLRAHQRDFA